MDKTFDEAYARYLRFLAKLDSAQDISEKNLLFRQLTEQLSDLESRLKDGSLNFMHDEPACDDPELSDLEVSYWN